MMVSPSPSSDPESVLRELFDQIVFVEDGSSSSSYGSMRGGLGVRFVKKGSDPDVMVVEFSDVFTGWIRKLCESSTRERIDSLICNILTDKITITPPPTFPAALSWLKDHLALDPGRPQQHFLLPHRLLLLRARSALFHTIDYSTAHQYPYRKRQKKIHHGSPTYAPTRRRSQRTTSLLKYGIGERKRIPLGPQFQAHVPDSISTEPQHMRWLGVRLWPVQEDNKIKTKFESIGKGRDDQCSCPSPRSIDCIRYHVKMSKLALANQLGLPFFSMGFDDMGEEVANSWTSDEQMAFQTLMREKPISAEAASLHPPLRGIPSKTRQNLVSYYFNVYNLRKMTMKTRSTCEQVDSDDDDNDGQT